MTDALFNRNVPSLNLRVADRAKLRIIAMMAGTPPGSFPAIVSLESPFSSETAASSAKARSAARFRLVVCPATRGDNFGPVRDKGEVSDLFQSAGFVFCVPQPQLVSRLAGKTLDAIGREIVVY